MGGSYADYAAFVSRQNVRHLWFRHRRSGARRCWFQHSQVKSGRLRKSLMHGSANGMLSDARSRAALGMLGGTALSMLHSSSDRISVASSDYAMPLPPLRRQSGRGLGLQCCLFESCLLGIGYDLMSELACARGHGCCPCTPVWPWVRRTVFEF